MPLASNTVERATSDAATPAVATPEPSVSDDEAEGDTDAGNPPGTADASGVETSVNTLPGAADGESPQGDLLGPDTLPRRD